MPMLVVYDIQLVVELDDDQEPTLDQVESALEQSTASEALSTALEYNARLRFPDRVHINPGSRQLTSAREILSVLLEDFRRGSDGLLYFSLRVPLDRGLGEDIKAWGSRNGVEIP